MEQKNCFSDKNQDLFPAVPSALSVLKEGDVWDESCSFYDFPVVYSEMCPDLVTVRNSFPKHEMSKSMLSAQVKNNVRQTPVQIK